MGSRQPREQTLPAPGEWEVLGSPPHTHAAFWGGAGGTDIPTVVTLSSLEQNGSSAACLGDVLRWGPPSSVHRAFTWTHTPRTVRKWSAGLGRAASGC